MKKAEGRNKQVSFLPGNALSFSAFAGCKKAWKRRAISPFFLLPSSFPCPVPAQPVSFGKTLSVPLKLNHSPGW
jgi:hypothetical protein